MAKRNGERKAKLTSSRQEQEQGTGTMPYASALIQFEQMAFDPQRATQTGTVIGNKTPHITGLAH